MSHSHNPPLNSLMSQKDFSCGTNWVRVYGGSKMSNKGEGLIQNNPKFFHQRDSVCSTAAAFSRSVLSLCSGKRWNFQLWNVKTHQCLLFITSSSPGLFFITQFSFRWAHVPLQEPERGFSLEKDPQRQTCAASSAPRKDLDLDEEEDHDEGDSFFDDPLPNPQKTYGWWAFTSSD